MLGITYMYVHLDSPPLPGQMYLIFRPDIQYTYSTYIVHVHPVLYMFYIHFPPLPDQTYPLFIGTNLTFFMYNNLFK